MIIQCSQNISDAERTALTASIVALGLKVSEVKTQVATYLVALGSYDIDIRRIGSLAGVTDVHRVSEAYKLVSKKWKVNQTIIDLGDKVTIGDGSVALMMGPCSIENTDQIASTVNFLHSQNVRIVRGGAFKPRTSPYSFRGLGIDGLKALYDYTSPLKMKIIAEVLDVTHIEAMYPYVDIYQVGTRNTQNFSLLHELGNVDKPVLIKRGMSGTIEELLQSAEYVFANGNEKILLCERGIRTFEKAYRNTFDINAIPVLKEKSHLPVIADPSHGIGVRRFVDKIALSATVAGADGLLIEVHERPEVAASDGDQTLSYEEAEKLIHSVRMLSQEDT